MSGYCAIGKVQTAIPPARVMMIDRTDAKIGRSMKNFENIAVAYPLESVATDRPTRLARRVCNPVAVATSVVVPMPRAELRRQAVGVAGVRAVGEGRPPIRKMGWLLDRVRGVTVAVAVDA